MHLLGDNALVALPDLFSGRPHTPPEDMGRQTGSSRAQQQERGSAGSRTGVPKAEDVVQSERVDDLTCGVGSSWPLVVDPVSSCPHPHWPNS